MDVIPPVIFDGEPVSATRIRECITAGRIKRANTLLGYRYSVMGIVGRGRGIGNSLGFPTANLCVPKEKIVPMRGVYSVDVLVDGDMYKGVCNVGVNPTVSSDKRESIEVHIISLSQDLYGQTVTIFFNKRIRDERKFSGTDALIEQIRMDISTI